MFGKIYPDNDKTSATHIFQIPLVVAYPVLGGYFCDVLADLRRVHGQVLPGIYQ